MEFKDYEMQEHLACLYHSSCKCPFWLHENLLDATYYFDYTLKQKAEMTPILVAGLGSLSLYHFLSYVSRMWDKQPNFRNQFLC